MATPKLSNLELRIIKLLWAKRECSIREILDSLPASRQPAYTTIQTTVYRMEAKGMVRRVRKVGNFHIFAASVSQDSVLRRLIDELLAVFGGGSKALMAHLIETGKLTLEDVKDAEKMLRKLSKKETGL
jgi:predicted transcriptional regulator